MGVLTPLGVTFLSAKKDLEIKNPCPYLCRATALGHGSNFNSLIMSQDINSRIELLKAVKSAVNTASFAPTSARIEDAKREVSRLMSYVESLEEGMKPKRRRKTKQKSGKATPSTKVADRQEKAFHGRPDTPVTPSTKKPKASVEAARKAAHDVSRHTGAESRAKRKAEKVKEAVVMPKAAPMNVTSDDKRLADLEAKIEALLALQAMGHDVMRNENEVVFSDLPFDPTTNL